MFRKILIMGLPGAGKTTLAKVLAPKLNAVHLNADAVRANLNKDLGFSEADRIEQARRLGWLCDQMARVGCFAIADFICPIDGAREAFLSGGDAFIVWIDRISVSAYDDTNRLFKAPKSFHLRVTAEGTPEFWAEAAMKQLQPVFDPKQPTALFVGRYQPFHDGHKALIVEGIKRVGQVCIAVRDSQGTSENNLFGFEHVRARIEHELREYEGRFVVVPFPNITNIFHGSDAGYTVERINLDSSIEANSATKTRLKLTATR